MTVLLLEGEEIIKKGSAKHQRGINMVKGQLTLTNRRLIFEPHQLIHRSTFEIIKLSHILDLRKEWTKIQNRVPIFPSTLVIVLKNGREHRFALRRRSLWRARIHEQRMA